MKSFTPVAVAIGNNFTPVAVAIGNYRTRKRTLLLLSKEAESTAYHGIQGPIDEVTLPLHNRVKNLLLDLR